MKPTSPLFSLVVALVASTPLFSQQLFPREMITRDFTEAFPSKTFNLPSADPFADADLLATACVTDDLELAQTVRCHPASRYLELRFNLAEGELTEPAMFEIYLDTVWLTNLSVEDFSGTIFIHNEHIGRTITVRQVGDSGCTRDFEVPACTESVCPLEGAGEAVPMACEGDMVDFRFALEHDPPIDISTSDFAVYDEKGDFLTIYSLGEADTLVHLFIPVSAAERQYTLCDLFNPEGCCVTVKLPGIDCNSIPSDVVDLGDLGVRLYPNPATDHIVLDLGDQLNLEGMSYRVSDVAGRPFSSGVVYGRLNTIITDTYPAGMYLVTLYADDSLVGYRRFVALR